MSKTVQKFNQILLAQFSALQAMAVLKESSDPKWHGADEFYDCAIAFPKKGFLDMEAAKRFLITEGMLHKEVPLESGFLALQFEATLAQAKGVVTRSLKRMAIVQNLMSA